MTEPLGVMFDQLYRRVGMAKALHCQPETITVLQDALYAVNDALWRITSGRRGRLRQRAEDLNWLPCPEVHAVSGRPMIDCRFCRTANAEPLANLPAPEKPSENMLRKMRTAAEVRGDGAEADRLTTELINLKRDA